MIFWQHIKGCYQDNAVNPARPQMYTWIQFQGKNPASGVGLTDQSNLPNIQVCETQTGSWQDCGHILTSKGTAQTLYGDGLTFKNSSGSGYPYSHISYNQIKCYQSANDFVLIDNGDTYAQLTVKHISDNRDAAIRLLGSSDQVVIHSSGNYLNFWFGSASGTNFEPARNFWKYDASNHTNTILGTLSVVANSSYSVNTAAIQSTGYIYAGSSTTHTTAGDISGINLYAGTKCEAAYFNATSDRRAKTNIQPLLIDALELVRKTQLYSFKYKETDTPSIGIIAQDVQNVDINGFKLVDNEEATGKDLDYMTIHESKLTYILWKAVQEQQDMIEKLKHEIEELKKN